MEWLLFSSSLTLLVNGYGFDFASFPREFVSFFSLSVIFVWRFSLACNDAFLEETFVQEKRIQFAKKCKNLPIFFLKIKIHLN